MTHTVFCRRLKKELPGLESPPFPGPKGQDVFDNVSAQAWDELQQHQTMLINEKNLNMMDKENRKFLNLEMERFLSGEAVDQIEGYVPPTQS
jgi:Fe-S cluster biosynthesis and repair protein YggX